MLTVYLMIYYAVMSGELCWAAKLFFSNFSNKKQKHRAVILAAASQKKEPAVLKLLFHFENVLFSALSII